MKSRTPWHMLLCMFCLKWIKGHATESNCFLSPFQLRVEESNIVAAISVMTANITHNNEVKDGIPILTSGTKFFTC